MKIGIAGANGRVGRLLTQELQSGLWDAQYVGGIDRDDDPNPLFEAAETVIEFSIPAATVDHARLAAETGTTLIACTTGLTREQEAALQNAAQKTVIV